jgi:hypothetical protein
VQASGVSAEAGATITETTGSVGAAAVLTNTGQAGATTGVQAISTLLPLVSTTQAAIGAGVGAATASQGAVSGAAAQHAAAAQGVGTLANTGAGSQEGPLALMVGVLVAIAGLLTARPRALWRRFVK